MWRLQYVPALAISSTIALKSHMQWPTELKQGALVIYVRRFEGQIENDALIIHDQISPRAAARSSIRLPPRTGSFASRQKTEIRLGSS